VLTLTVLAGQVSNVLTVLVLVWTFSIMGYAGYAGCWNVTEDHHIPGGTNLPFAKTEESCKEQCIKDSTCAAIDWSDSKRYCWIHSLAESKLDAVKDLSYSVYRLNPACSGSS